MAYLIKGERVFEHLVQTEAQALSTGQQLASGFDQHSMSGKRLMTDRLVPMEPKRPGLQGKTSFFPYWILADALALHRGAGGEQEGIQALYRTSCRRLPFYRLVSQSQLPQSHGKQVSKEDTALVELTMIT